MNTGDILMHGDDTVLPGFLLCDGQAVSRSTYAALFALIGTTYGVGDNSTTFNVPDLGTRTTVGLDSGDGDFDALGDTGGAKTANLQHSHTMNSHTHAYASGSPTGAASNSVAGDHTPRETGAAPNNHTHTLSAISSDGQSDAGTDNQLSTTQSILMRSITIYPLIKT